MNKAPAEYIKHVQLNTQIKYLNHSECHKHFLAQWFLFRLMRMLVIALVFIIAFDILFDSIFFRKVCVHVSTAKANRQLKSSIND